MATHNDRNIDWFGVELPVVFAYLDASRMLSY
jgi:hypothetical protein